MKPESAAQEGSAHHDMVIREFVFQRRRSFQIYSRWPRWFVCTCVCVCRGLFTHMCIDVGEGVAFTNAFVPEACTAVYIFFFFCPLPVSMQKCVYIAQGWEVHLQEEVMLLSCSERSVIRVWYCVDRLRLGSCLHADSRVFAMQKQQKDQRSI